MSPVPNIILPAGYHVRNFTVLLNTVYGQYADLLSEPERHLYDAFHACSADAQSLLVRMLTRKGNRFRQDKLQHYEDVKDARGALEELNRQDLIQPGYDTPPEEWLHFLTKSELAGLLTTKSVSSTGKSILLSTCLTQIEANELVARLSKHYPLWFVSAQSSFETYLACFFGNSHQDLTEFVMTDLGLQRFEDYPLDATNRFFSNRNQIEQQRVYSSAREQLDQRQNLDNADWLEALAHALPQPEPHSALSRRYQKLLLTIARQLERLDQDESALHFYRLCEQHPSRERQARILKKQGHFEGSLQLCNDILHCSRHPDEIDFVYRFRKSLNRQLPKQKQITGHPVTSPVGQLVQERLTLPYSETTVELAVAQALTTETVNSNIADHEQQLCLYVENALFGSLFGLFFWDIIFQSLPGAFINPFQRGPLDLFSEHFYHTRQDALDQRLSLLHDTPSLQDSTGWKRIILDHFQKKFGISNGFVNWECLEQALGISIENCCAQDKPACESQNLLEFSLQRIPASHLLPIFRQMLQHPGLYRSGFPDLICFNKTGYELVEVKGPGDKLQTNQTRWLQFFRLHRIPAKVIWVAYEHG